MCKIVILGDEYKYMVKSIECETDIEIVDFQEQSPGKLVLKIRWQSQLIKIIEISDFTLQSYVDWDRCLSTGEDSAAVFVIDGNSSVPLDESYYVSLQMIRGRFEKTRVYVLVVASDETEQKFKEILQSQHAKLYDKHHGNIQETLQSALCTIHQNIVLFWSAITLVSKTCIQILDHHIRAITPSEVDSCEKSPTLRAFIKQLNPFIINSSIIREPTIKKVRSFGENTGSIRAYIERIRLGISRKSIESKVLVQVKRKSYSSEDIIHKPPRDFSK
jgi:hypothetical protein